MAKIHFYLKSPNNQESLIIKQLSFRGSKMRSSTGDRIPVSIWDKRTERPRRGRDYRKWTHLTEKLDLIEDEFLYEFRLLVRDNEDSVTNVANIFYEDKKHNKAPTTLIAFMEYIIKEKEGRNQTTGVYQNTVNRLKKRHPRDIEFKDITIDWYNQYVAWMQNIKWKDGKKGGYYSKNTIGKDIKNIKAVLNQAKLRGLTDVDIQKTPYFKSFAEDVYYTYLSMEEIERLHGYDFSKKKQIDQNSVDWWLIFALTGMRVSDGKRLTKENLSADGNFFIQDMKKVSGRVEVPLHRIVREILEKYDGVPKSRAEQTINKHIKRACFLAGIKAPVVSTRTEGGQKVTRKKEKWEVVSTHTGRRSLATNMYLAGFPLEAIRLMTGHSTTGQLLKYIKVTSEEAARSIKDHSFWGNK